MMGMVEKVARAMLSAHDFSSGGFETMSPEWQETYRSMARAAIEAMREPTEHMLVIGSCHEDPEDRYAGDISLGIKNQGDIAGEVFKSMIDAALSEAREGQ